MEIRKHYTSEVEQKKSLRAGENHPRKKRNPHLIPPLKPHLPHNIFFALTLCCYVSSRYCGVSVIPSLSWAREREREKRANLWTIFICLTKTLSIVPKQVLSNGIIEEISLKRLCVCHTFQFQPYVFRESC